MKTSKVGPCVAIIGAQYGLEGVGDVIGHLADNFSVHYRVNGGLSGHLVEAKSGYARMGYIPSGWVNQEAILLIGKNVPIDPSILIGEITRIYAQDPSIIHRLFIDKRCPVAFAGDKPWSDVAAMVTGLVSRSDPTYTTLESVAENYTNSAQGWSLATMLHPDVSATALDLLNTLHSVLIEGIGGIRASLTSPEWPNVLPINVSTAQLAADAGIPPAWVQSVLVASPYTLRGVKMAGKHPLEISWQEMTKRQGIPRPIGLDARIGEDATIGGYLPDMLKAAVDLTGATQLIFTRVDWADYKANRTVAQAGAMSDTLKTYLQYTSHSAGVAIPFVITSKGKVITLSPFYKPQVMITTPDLVYFGDKRNE